MASNTFNIHFFIKKEKVNKRGLVPIVARVRINGSKTEISTNRTIHPNLWLLEKEAAKPVDAAHKQLNEHLEAFKVKLYANYSKLLSSNKPINIHSFKAFAKGEKVIVKCHTLIETAKEHNQQFEKLIGIKYSYGSYKNYKTTLKYLIEFVPQYKCRKDILLSEVNFKFCEAFFSWLTSVKNCRTNGANKQIQRLKKIINFSIKSGYITTNPMQTYSLNFKPYDKVVLSIGEIRTLLQLKLQRETLRKVKDVFLFQCYTGLSYSDISRLGQEHLLKDENGELWIKMKRQKTEVQFSIPLLPPAMAILKDYLKQGEQDRPIFNVLSNQKMNVNLKVIQELAGISKNLTTHLARHTFATTITLNNGVPIETVSKMLGHTNLKTTQVYAKVLDNKIAHDMQALKEKLE